MDSPTVLVTTRGSWGKPVPRGHSMPPSAGLFRLCRPEELLLTQNLLSSQMSQCSHIMHYPHTKPTTYAQQNSPRSRRIRNHHAEFTILTQNILSHYAHTEYTITLCSHRVHPAHTEYTLLTLNPPCSHRIHPADTESTLLSQNPPCSHRIHPANTESTLLTQNPPC
jgi:hypothetical protein